MRYLFKALGSIVLCLSFGLSSAQQVPMYSQYIMNGFLINPSLTGRDGATTVNLTVREQWLGVKGGPSTYAASFQTALQDDYVFGKSRSGHRKKSRPSKSGRVGIGGYLFNDNNGIVRRTGFQTDYAYNIPMGRNLKGSRDQLSFGLALTGYQFVIRTDELKNSYDDDPYLNSYDRSVFITDFNFGTSYVTSKYFIGFSMTNLLRGSLVFGNSADNKIAELGHYFLTGGFNIPIDRDWSIKPSAFIKSSDMLLNSVQLDLTGRVFYREDYWAGVSYRTNDAVILMVGLKYDKFYFGYAFDLTLTDMRNNSLGTMELTLAYKFGGNSGRYRWMNSF
ncbi:MAG: type IX secretion system membrane protein PorP/SprF [Bacteroidales bacterium]|nr:type IX secretion system membrane protein PorP/SprF [Bacteroidales bacterium]MBK8881834.1 type IX secretion system membrane protein PorP/SprF [Bacteroidales bacterium]